MKRLAILALGTVVAAFASSSPAQAQNYLLEGCNTQCQQTYDARANYCYTRYGGYNYDAELCIMNEYEVLLDCQRECETTYGGGYARGDAVRVPGMHSQGRACG